MDSEFVLKHLHQLVASYRWFALLQHIVVLSLLYLLGKGRLSGRVLSVYLGFVALGVSALALASGLNVFNGGVFLVVGVALFATSKRNKFVLPPLTRSSAIGFVLLATGLWYPHFVDALDVLLLRSPFGLVPCPTLMVTLGLLYLNSESVSRGLQWFLAAVGLFYGITGTVLLRVPVDLPLVLVALAILARLLSTRFGRKEQMIPAK